LVFLVSLHCNFHNHSSRFCFLSPHRMPIILFSLILSTIDTTSILSLTYPSKHSHFCNIYILFYSVNRSTLRIQSFNSLYS
jgi:hypothetical protein